MTTDTWTKDEMLAMLDDDTNVDRWCNACDWLAEISGQDVPDAEYSQESIRDAVDAEDPSLLRPNGR